MRPLQINYDILYGIWVILGHKIIYFQTLLLLLHWRKLQEVLVTALSRSFGRGERDEGGWREGEQRDGGGMGEVVQVLHCSTGVNPDWYLLARS